MTKVMNRKPIFDTVRPWIGGWTDEKISAMDTAIDLALGIRKIPVKPAPKKKINIQKSILDQFRQARDTDQKALQRAIGLKSDEVDGNFGPKSAEALIKALSNINAPALTLKDYQAAAKRLGVPLENIQAAFYKESARGGFGVGGLIKILNEGQWFSRLTRGAFDRIVPTLSYPRWTKRFYARTMRARYLKLAKKCRHDVEAAFASCSWGAPQVMGFHAKSLGFPDAVTMAFSLAKDEKSHLELFIRFIEKNKLQDELAACRANDRASCIRYSRGYNGTGFAKNNYAEIMANLIHRFKIGTL